MKPRTKRYDAVVIGAGAAGMSAACAIRSAGFRVAIVEREEYLGGILQQCIHNGFGLHHFKKELTGPEYAEELINMVAASKIDVYLETTVISIRKDTSGRTLTSYSAKHGVVEFKTRAVVLAMGCRERNRGNIGVPGGRPAGVFTAGLAQRLLNIDGYVPGKRVVVVGSGDIGLIMARRMTWVGAKVLCVVEILPYPSGLTRNIVQCLQDFGIPLYLSHSVTNIAGKNRVEGIQISPLVNGVPQTDKSFRVVCDTVLLSVGLIPENELSRTAGVELSPNTNGPVVGHDLQTNEEGIFACGNVLHVHDLVDFVSEESEHCGDNVVRYLKGTKSASRTTVDVDVGANLKYVVPNRCLVGTESTFLMRSLVVKEKAVLCIRQGKRIIKKKALRHVKPAEMISVQLTKDETACMRPKEPVSFCIK